jgi:hypothetical protein
MTAYVTPMAWDWSRIVFDHVTIGVRDADTSKRFYRTVTAGSSYNGTISVGGEPI